MHKSQRGLSSALKQILDLKYKAITIGREYKRNIHHVSILESLLHSIFYGVDIVLSFNSGNRFVRLEEQDIISPQRFFTFAIFREQQYDSS